MIKKIQQPLTTICDRYSHDGRGVAHINKKTTFIDGALPNEEITFVYTRNHSKYDEGKVLEVISASPDRVIPQCKHAAICGGCSQQHITHYKQLELKQLTLLEQLKHFGNIQPETLLPPLTGPIFGYRHRARLGVKYVTKKNKVLVGFHEKNGRYLADIDSCAILHPKVGTIIDKISELIIFLASSQKIPQIEVAIADNAAALTFRHLESLCTEDLNKIIAFAKQYDFYIYLQPKGIDSIHLLYPENTPDFLFYKLPEYNIEILFFPTDFTQINQVINNKMLNLAVNLLEPNNNDRILDLFCGLGNFTLPFARLCKSIVGIEGSKEMVARAQKNAEHNNINNAEFYCADLSLPNIESNFQGLNINTGFNKLILDPPRTGAAEIIKNINIFKAEKILYISCNPATLARDSGILAAHGYKLKCSGIIDMFPHTKHVEAIALFTI